MCRAVVCRGCEREHLDESCSMAGAKVCVVCGMFLKTSVCDRCGTWFCERHQDHDCLTPKSGDRDNGRETGLGLLRSELEKGLSRVEQPVKAKSKVVIRVDAPGGWDQGEELWSSLAAGDEEALRSRRLGGSTFLSGARAEGFPMAVGGGSFPGIPMSREGNRPRSWANPTLIQEETEWVSALSQ